MYRQLGGPGPTNDDDRGDFVRMLVVGAQIVVLVLSIAEGEG